MFFSEVQQHVLCCDFKAEIKSLIEKVTTSIGKHNFDDHTDWQYWLSAEEIEGIDDKTLIIDYKKSEKKLIEALKQENLNGVNHQGIVFYYDSQNDKLCTFFGVWPLDELSKSIGRSDCWDKKWIETDGIENVAIELQEQQVEKLCNSLGTVRVMRIIAGFADLQN